MYCVYVLRSVKSRKRYVGMTSQDVYEKVSEHNEGATTWTSSDRPFILVYHEMRADKRGALKREKFLKSGDGRRFLDRKLELLKM